MSAVAEPKRAVRGRLWSGLSSPLRPRRWLTRWVVICPRRPRFLLREVSRWPMCCFATSPAGCSSTPTCAPSPMSAAITSRTSIVARHPARRPRRQLVGKHGLARIEVVATDLAESFRAGLSPHLDHARRVADPFHVVRVANRCVDQVRRRIQNETVGSSRPQACAALPDPQAAPHRQRTPRPAWLGSDAVGAAHRRPTR